MSRTQCGRGGEEQDVNVDGLSTPSSQFSREAPQGAYSDQAVLFRFRITSLRDQELQLFIGPARQNQTGFSHGLADTVDPFREGPSHVL